jgi:hypothetical protein
MKKTRFDLKQYDEYRLHNPETKTFLGKVVINAFLILYEKYNINSNRKLES